MTRQLWAVSLAFLLGSPALAQQPRTTELKAVSGSGEIDKTSLDSLEIAGSNSKEGMSGQQLVDYVGQAADLGFDQAIFSIRNVSDPGVFDTIAKVESQIAAVPEGGRK